MARHGPVQALSILRGQVCDPDEEQVKEKSAGNSALFTGCCSASLQSSKGSRRAASAASLFSLHGGCFFMKVVMINGSPHKNGSTAEALREIGHGLTDGGAESELLHIGAEVVPGCWGCFACRTLQRCVIDDCVNRAAEILRHADGRIVALPVYFFSPTGTLISFLDRLYAAHGEVLVGGTAHHPFLLLVHGARQHAGGSARRCRGDAHRLYAGQAHGGIHPKALLKTKQERGPFLSALLLRFIKLTARS